MPSPPQRSSSGLAPGAVSPSAHNNPPIQSTSCNRHIRTCTGTFQLSFTRRASAAEGTRSAEATEAEEDCLGCRGLGAAHTGRGRWFCLGGWGDGRAMVGLGEEGCFQCLDGRTEEDVCNSIIHLPACFHSYLGVKLCCLHCCETTEWIGDI